MAKAQEFEREKNGHRFDFRGINTVLPVDALPEGKYPYAQNIRRYKKQSVFSRAIQSAALFTTLASGVQSVRRLNDSTPGGPAGGFVIVYAAGTGLYVGNTQVDNGLSGKKISIVPFRPNQSVRPWAYIADDSEMVKVQSDGTKYKTGIAEPQVPPTVSFPGGGGGGNQIFYRYVYRSSKTGALSNGSPESASGSFAQSNQSIPSPSFPTANLSYNPGQWQVNASQLRTTGAATASPQLLDYVIASNFGFSVPSTANIVGIQIDLNWVSQSQTSANIAGVSLFYGGVKLGSVKSPGTNPQTSNSDVIQGSSADSWGATLTPAIVNDPTFGFGIQVAVQNVRLFLNSFTITVYWSNPNGNVTPTASTDPQVDKIDFYRQGGALANFTYVGTGPNSATAFTDTLTDAVALANPTLPADNFEPFPSIDLPRSGVLSASGGNLTWVSGDTFNTRWLPGTVIVINGVAYTTDRRPASTTALFVTGVPNGTNYGFSISLPILAAQPMRSMWGPTDNVAFMFACGDPLRPGTLYFTKGNNPDSAPDTNSIEVTSPSEPLQGGTIVNGLSLVGSTERFWLAYPNFFNALATVTGTSGSPFTLVLSISNRGLFAKKGICNDGGQNAFFVGKDGVYKSPGGNGSQSITDDDLYNLFPHEGEVQQNITIAGVTLFAPDFTRPDDMDLSYSNGFVYYDYKDENGNPRTLVYDNFAAGWVVDVYQFPALTHATEEGPVEGVLLGCTDGTVRTLSNVGVETGTALILTPAFNAGDVRAQKQFGDVFIEAQIAASNAIAIALYTAFFANPLVGFSPASLGPNAAVRSPFIIDFQNDTGVLAVDLEAKLSWSLDQSTGIYTWQPTIVPQPESVQGRPTDWDDTGFPGTKFIQGVSIEADSFNLAKTFQVQLSDDLSMHTPNEVPATWNGQSTKSFSFTPPLIGHSVRIISMDGVAWRRYGIRWIFEPYPDSVFDYETEGTSHGLVGFQHIRELNIPHVSTADLTLSLVFDTWPTIVLTIANSGGKFIKSKVTVNSNKFKIVSYKLSSSQGFRFFKRDLEVKVKQWGSSGSYQILRPFGGVSSEGAEV